MTRIGDKRLPKEFWAQLRPRRSGCWEWVGGSTANGYGRARLTPGDNGRTVAHRVAYLRLVGPVPRGLELDHLCRNRLCCNPAHLEAVTHQENMRRSPITQSAFANRVAAQKSITHCPSGHEYTEDNTRNDKRGCRVCRTCQRAAQVAWRAANREKLNAEQTARRLANPDLHRARCRASYHKHKHKKKDDPNGTLYLPAQEQDA